MTVTLILQVLASCAEVREGHCAKNTVAARTIANDLPRTGCEENLISPLENVLLAYAVARQIEGRHLFSDASIDTRASLGGVHVSGRTVSKTASKRKAAASMS